MVSRRRLLTAVASAAAVTGCLSSPDASAADGTETSTRTTETTTRTTETTTTTEKTRDRATDDTKYDRTVVENRTDTEHRVSVAIELDGETLHEGTYRVPAKTGLRIEQQFDWGTQTVRAAVDGGETRTYEWEHGSCANTPHPNGNQNAGVVVEPGEWLFVTNGCDYLKLGQVYVEEYAPASEHTVTSTTA
ncbi:hypothetical protein HALDL1_09800 [Halobacterium sp. DL1]|jgi:RNA polymerase-binding transcription factor DksA|nr:hypothetical protein HALDL1_09800 [Halobacterium sp. DL1]